MPELPEVEVVRAGLQAHVAGRVITRVEVLHPRAIRRHALGPEDFTGRLAGARVEAARRRGKYLWLELSDKEAILAHLGMSGQMLVQPDGAPDEKHLRVRVRFDDEGPELRFVDQRTFGGLALADLVDTGSELLPAPIAHIARDPMDAAFDPAQAVRALRSRRTEVKRALLDQTLVSGVGNIYADEALWRARLHWSRPTEKLTNAQGTALLAAAADVMGEALRAGGTSFDALYVNVNGQSGYFDRSLDVYGQADRPCARCGTAIVREPFMNRSSYFCPRCQPRPRRPRA
ncbi:bifunctional DNA-formamidopyrimidine glycosylase/DNA-(apurinic or apyrimidinic site) lyase [Amycolatopsis acidiphila]|uniref:Formamidopyrimidine-DNA glycosylase n=1 Tax=Amycolatopsis acidiphila TaxID=715473 RepID=A0A558AC54_9PSEU|nr:bifunctional DNA-formamidopyrimidine glycosylase/DNA-(apurinic or apyrimidinic site) lyase [Amycolatopsis acidiphila]TVT21815.1 bifunctional DNA-formamidopyrimidine glycosylase/DNA-(apurinic or apyrimidinic site) lyase [Amycolatopsis acidiphila]UIJ61535.1 bifunctional DNA-formamidopyrimidine glycosylase/DNA-(apurinic or apyrimidinic site) lyase [Amycolatopsis acidiphila]GHG59381.1 formamidopyrimidine-DNA glycosylase [Amycolatopsis acidiphila]